MLWKFDEEMNRGWYFGGEGMERVCKGKEGMGGKSIEGWEGKVWKRMQGKGWDAKECMGREG